MGSLNMVLDHNDMVENPTPRVPISLVLDVSGSMEGAPLEELNEGVASFFRSLQEDEVARYAAEVSVITFGDQVTQVVPFGPLDTVTPPILTARGKTRLGEAVSLALVSLERRKELYQALGVDYYQPWMVLMTDGKPTDDVAEASRTVHRLCADRKLVFFGVGVGDGANMDRLGAICPPNRPPRRLQGLRFAEFFQWLSRSMASVSRSAGPDARVALPPADGWAAI